MRSLARLAILAALLAGAVLLAVAFGAVSMSLGEIIRAARGAGDPTAVAIVQNLRIPRAVQAALVGAALAASGATFQALLRNPLAEPYILGVSGGAAVGAVLAIVLGVATVGWVIPAASFAGSLIAIALVLRIARSVGPVLDTRVLLLSGVVVGAFFNAVIMLALTFADVETFQAAVFWMMGSFSGATWSASGVVALALAPGILVLLALARSLNLLAIGEETAAYLGTSVERTKLLAYGTASLLAATAVAMAGMIGFVGLIIPHVIRMLWGSDHRFLILASALLGGAFLVLVDTAARTAAAPSELPVGVVTAFIGVPFFLWLLTRGTGEAAESTPEDGATARAAHPASGLSISGAALHDTAPADTPAWTTRAVTFGYPGARRPALSDVSIDVPTGSCTAVLGPNGSGKSTLLRVLLGTQAAARGSVELHGRPLDGWSRGSLARTIAVVPQGEEISFPIRVRELVAMGRYPYLGPWRREGERDRAAIQRAMERCDVAELADRPISTLSGGERQRARLARALAQETRVLALDEPTAALDIRHEMEIFELLRGLRRDGVTVLLVTHHLNLASRYADRLVVLQRGAVAAAGSPVDVLDRDLIERVYGWPVLVTPFPGAGPDHGVPQIVPLGGSGARSRRPATSAPPQPGVPPESTMTTARRSAPEAARLNPSRSE